MAPTNDSPISFEIFEANHIKNYVHQKRGLHGQELSPASAEQARSGIMFLFNMYKVARPSWDSQLIDYFKGIRRISAQKASANGTPASNGKRPLDFEFYQILEEAIVTQPKKSYILAHAMGILSWNLMSRGSESASISLNHMEWLGDALIVYYPVSKTDQLGARASEFRSVYANPDKPMICPILALAMYWLLYPFDPNDHFLFPKGLSSFKIYQDKSQKIMDGRNATVSKLLRDRGLSSSDFGSHSKRKGCATYVCNGTPNGASHAAISHRLGHSLGRVGDIYFTKSSYAPAGDQQVGRLAAGLPPNSPSFASLPPRFMTHSDRVSSLICDLFPYHPPTLREVLKFALASLVYHSSFLRDKLPESHPIFRNQIFCDDSLIPSLLPLIRSGPACPDDVMTATGIPAYVMLIDKVSDVTPSVLNGVSKLLDEREVLSSNITRDYFDRTLNTLRSEIQRGNSAPATTEVARSAEDDEMLEPVFCINGLLRRVPGKFVVPKADLLRIFHMYFLGDSSTRSPPLRLLTTRDMATKDGRRITDLHFLMRTFKGALGISLWPSVLTLHECSELFIRAMSRLGLPATTPTGRKRVRTQMDWKTLVRHLRTQARKSQINSVN